MVDPREPVLPLFDDEAASIPDQIETQQSGDVETISSRDARISADEETRPEPMRKPRKSVGGRPKSRDPKIPISIRLDRAVVEKFRATGPGWQSRINEALREAKP